MRDKRTVDELSIEELEQALVIKRRAERQKKLERMQRSGRTVDVPTVKEHPSQAAVLAATASAPAPTRTAAPTAPNATPVRRL